MKRPPIRLGPLALLLAVICVCLTVLAMLTYSTARADRRLADKFAQTVTTRYELETRGQELLRELSESDPALAVSDWERDASGVYWTTLEQDGSVLRIGLTVSGGDYEVAAWIQERVWEQDTHIQNLWPGF